MSGEPKKLVLVVVDALKPSMLERAIAAGCAVYVSKPVDRRRLLDLIGSMIRP